MHALVPSLLFTLAAGKLIGVLGGSGQGTPFNGQWATAYLGPGPWGSLAADVPSHPSQVYEGILVGLVVVAMALITRIPFVRRGNGSAMFAALALWAAARFAVAFTWRDVAVVGTLRMEQIRSSASRSSASSASCSERGRSIVSEPQTTPHQPRTHHDPGR